MMASTLRRRLINWFPWFWFGKAFFKAFFKTKALGIALVHAKGTVLQCNESFIDFLGRPEGMYCRKLNDLFPQLGQWIELPLDKSAIVDPNGLSFETFLDQSNTTVKAMLFPLQNIWGKNSFYVLYLMDISNLLEHQNSIRLSEAKFKSVFHSVSDLIIIFDKHDGVILDVNEGWKRILNCSPKQMVGKNISEVDFFADRQLVLSAIEETMLEGKTENIELPIVCSTGERFMGLASIHQINYGNRSELILNIHDITESKLIEQLLSFIANLAWSSEKDTAIPQLLTFVADQIGSAHMVVSKIDHDLMVAQTMAFIKHGKLVNDIRYNLEGTPCRDVYNGDICIINSDLQQRFPNDFGLVAMQAESYIGVPIVDSKLTHIGIVAAIHTKSFKNPHLVSKLLQIAAKPIGNEMERIYEEQLRKKQERKYRQLFENLTSAMALHEIICDETGTPVDYRFIEANPAFLTYLGIEREQLIGRTVRNIWPQTETYWIEMFGSVALTGASQIFEDYSQSFNRYYSGVAYSPAPNQFAVIFLDVTEFRLKDLELKEREAQLNTIFENTPSALLLVNENAEIVQMNPAGYRLAKNSELVQVQGQTVGNVLKCINSYVAEGGCGNAPACMECKLRQMLMNTFFKLNHNSRTEMLFRQATEVAPQDLYFIVSSALVGSKGQNQVLITLEEITSQKIMELDLVDSKNKAQESDRLKSAFFNNLSHEIRTPLNGIVGFSNLLRKEEISKDEIGVFVNLINENSNRLLQIMNNVIELSQISSGNYFAKQRTIDLQTLIPKCLASCIEVYKSKHIDVDWDVKGPTKFVSDYNAVQGIITQLLLNALKFTVSGSVSVRWYVGVNHASCIVSDTGTGIDKKDYLSIFTPFKQVEDGMTRSFGGVGIGLAIVKGYLDALGGTITVKSEKGRGSLFRFSIPIGNFSAN